MIDDFITTHRAVLPDACQAELRELVAGLEREKAKLHEELQNVRFASHVPDDYRWGLASWIRQHLYACWVGANLSPNVQQILEGAIKLRTAHLTNRVQELEAKLEARNDH